MSKKILFFSPHAGIAISSAMEAKLAAHLKSSGHEVHYVSCNQTLRPYCVNMSAHALVQDSPEHEKNRVCKMCEKSSRFVARRYGLNRLSLKDFLTAEDLKEVKNIVNTVTKVSFSELKHIGVPVGRKALYEFLLQYKKSDLEFNETEWRHYKIALETSLKSLIAGSRIIDQVKPDLIVCYNTQYGVNGVIEAYGKNHNIPTYFIHAGLNLSRILYDLMIAVAPPPQYYKRIAEQWPRFAKTPIQATEVQKVLGHMRELFKASSVFVYSSTTTSKRPDIRRLYGISPNQKILAATMSSYDERFAAESNLTLEPAKDSIFKTQIEWIQFLIEYVKEKPDLFLLIRVHPREFPNKRERMKSEHAEKLAKIFERLPDNVSVNWPTDQVSLYHMAEEASVFLNAWSSTGKEMGALGRPVVLYSKELPFYATDINYTASTPDEYIAMIEKSLERPFDFQRIVDAFRLFNLEFHRATLDISSMFDQKDLYPRLASLRRVEGKILRYTSSIWQLRRLCRKPAVLAPDQAEVLAKQLQNPPADLIQFRNEASMTSELEERKALIKALQEIFDSLYPHPISASNPYTSLYEMMKKFLSEH